MTETTVTPQVEETEPVTLESLAQAGTDPYVSKVYPLISGVKAEMVKLVEALQKYTPPNQLVIHEFLYKGSHDKAADNDPYIVEVREKLAKVEKEANDLRAKLHNRAKEILQPETLPAEELSKLQGKFAENREIIKGQLDAMNSYADVMGVDGLKDAVKAFSIPRFANVGSGSAAAAVRNPEAHACREWAKANGMTVSERGKISEDVWKAYREATGK